MIEAVVMESYTYSIYLFGATYVNWNKRKMHDGDQVDRVEESTTDVCRHVNASISYCMVPRLGGQEAM